MGEYTGDQLRMTVTSILRGPIFGLPAGMCIMSVRPTLSERPHHHALKTWPEHYLELAVGSKTFELRKDDRGFRVGDVLLLREYRPCDEERDAREEGDRE